MNESKLYTFTRFKIAVGRNTTALSLSATVGIGTCDRRAASRFRQLRRFSIRTRPTSVDRHSTTRLPRVANPWRPWSVASTPEVTVSLSMALVTNILCTHARTLMCFSSFLPPSGGSTVTQPVGIVVCVIDVVGWPQSISMMFCGISANWYTSLWPSTLFRIPRA